jgi:hypothetical protein
MKRIALALMFATGIANAGNFAYEAAFNQHGFSTIQTATMGGTDASVVWFITPDEGHYVIQIAPGSDSANVEHLVTIVNANTNAIVMTQQGYYPAFYVTIGAGLDAATPYLMYVNNADGNDAPTCDRAWLCNVAVMIQPAL